MNIPVLSLLVWCGLLCLARGQEGADIINGEDAFPGEYPWVVALVYDDEPDTFFAHFCGGTLVHPRWIITAAHCVYGISASGVQAMVGAHDLNDPGAIRAPIDDIIVHPQYRPWSDDYDIALLRLAAPSDAPWIPMISDPTMDDAGLLATTMGWGAITTSLFDPRYTNILQKVDVPIVSNTEANRLIAYGGEITTNMLAAGYAAGGKDSCGGDSGGPLVVYNPDIDSWTLAGIVSWGNGCAKPYKYGIYARVANFRRWALGHMMYGYRSFEDVYGIRGRLHDPDLDGYGNLLEYAHNSDPTRYVPANKPQAVLTDDGSGPVPAIQYRRLKGTTLIGYHPEVSRDGGISWDPVDPDANQVGLPIDLNQHTELVTVRDPAPSGTYDHSMLRVRISQQP